MLEHYARIGKKAIRTVLVSTSLALLLAGCRRSPEPRALAREYVEGWAEMGMWLPTEQVPFFAEYFRQTEEVLVDALSDENPDVRQRAAYVIEELGPQAKSLEDELGTALEAEKSRLLRFYLYSAMQSIGVSDPALIKALRERFDRALSNSKADEGWHVHSVGTGELYTDTDEAIYIASALFVLDDEAGRRPEYLHTVIQWLKPPGPDLSQGALRAYWDHRWCAVNAVEHMQGAKEAIPLLEHMLHENGRKPWVGVHVPRALNALRATSHPEQILEPAEQ